MVITILISSPLSSSLPTAIISSPLSNHCYTIALTQSLLYIVVPLPRLSNHHCYIITYIFQYITTSIHPYHRPYPIAVISSFYHHPSYPIPFTPQWLHYITTSTLPSSSHPHPITLPISSLPPLVLLPNYTANFPVKLVNYTTDIFHQPH
ncbi:hypothetical protein BDM02DRAFT_3192915 [Thelephora ganbajun]|uniref:Uncharacterized protein n=1 Tax=Thelephora ganbajun TaxID=370292 RepID=A0ACB6Z0I6_THEGA|nr:hypothetical protein BDM02DRAFT_3192915 [Thelephora ganbajun]